MIQVGKAGPPLNLTNLTNLTNFNNFKNLPHPIR